MRVQYDAGSGVRTGDAVGFVHVAAAPQPGPIGERSPPEPAPNIWAVVSDDKTGMLVSVPTWKVRRAQQ